MKYPSGINKDKLVKETSLIRTCIRKLLDRNTFNNVYDIDSFKSDNSDDESLKLINDLVAYVDYKELMDKYAQLQPLYMEMGYLIDDVHSMGNRFTWIFKNNAKQEYLTKQFNTLYALHKKYYQSINTDLDKFNKKNCKYRFNENTEYYLKQLSLMNHIDDDFYSHTINSHELSDEINNETKKLKLFSILFII